MTDACPLLALPAEILQVIIDCNTESSWPTLAILRRTHRRFYNVITSELVRDKPSKLALQNQLQTLDVRFSYLLPPGHHPCLTCLRVKSSRSFADDFEIRKERCCLECGIIGRKFSSERAIFIQGVDYRHRTNCGESHSVKHRGGSPFRHLFAAGDGIWRTLFFSAAVLLVMESYHNRAVTARP